YVNWRCHRVAGWRWKADADFTGADLSKECRYRHVASWLRSRFRWEISLQCRKPICRVAYTREPSFLLKSSQPCVRLANRVEIEDLDRESAVLYTSSDSGRNLPQTEARPHQPPRADRGRCWRLLASPPPLPQPRQFRSPPNKTVERRYPQPPESQEHRS